MVQFKNVFTGQEQRPYSRATTAQKCVRAGGKHNDLDNVGYTARHHTFFEMLGNFSFGDYFKEQAIAYAWELLTKRFRPAQGPAARHRLSPRTTKPPSSGRKSPACRMSGSSASRPTTISGAWAIPAPAARARRFSTTTAPASPAARPAAPDEDGDRFIEIWNLVFMQFEEGPPGTRVPLPRPSIDTGMGLERFAAILQGKHDNYDTDTLRALILASAEATGHGPGRAEPHQPPRDRRPSAQHRLPDRRRRAAVQRGPRLRAAPDHAPCHAPRAHDGRREPVMYRLVPALVRQMGAAYPELVRAEPLITETLQLEENRFKAMLERGLHLLARGDRQARRRPAAARRRSRSGSTTRSASRWT